MYVQWFDRHGSHISSTQRETKDLHAETIPWTGTNVRIDPTYVLHEQSSLDSSETEHASLFLSERIAIIRSELIQSMLTRWVPSLFRRPAGPSRLHPLQPIGKCFFGKTRIVVEGSTKAPTTHTVELNPFNKLRTVSKRTGLPSSHILKALCTREGKSFYLKVELE